MCVARERLEALNTGAACACDRGERRLKTRTQCLGSPESALSCVLGCVCAGHARFRGRRAGCADAAADRHADRDHAAAGTGTQRTKPLDPTHSPRCPEYLCFASDACLGCNVVRFAKRIPHSSLHSLAALQVPVVVKVDGQQSAALTFNYDAPVVTSLLPLTGSVGGGFNLTITGNNFGLTPTVSVGGANCPGKFLIRSALDLLDPCPLSRLSAFPSSSLPVC